MLFLHQNANASLVDAVNSGINPKGNESQYVHMPAERFSEVAAAVGELAARLELSPSDLVAMNRVLRDWMSSTEYDRKQKDIYGMMSAEGMKAREAEGQLANWRYYNNYIDLTLALYGEVLCQKNLERENEVAKAVLQDLKVARLMVSVARKITAFAEKEDSFSGKRDALLRGNYATLHAAYTWAEWCTRYSGLSTQELVPCLYDITMSFKKVFAWTEPPMDGGRITKDNMRMNVATPNEDFYWTSRARWAEVPVWAAPSYTAQLMLLVAQRAGASEEELRAFAYAIYAYWNQVYPHTATPVHRMFGVMTTAREFGAPEAACDPTKMYKEALKFLMPRSKL